MFKKFEQVNQRMESRITITNNKAFGFPTKLYKDEHLDRFKYVVLFYDDQESKVGFKFANEEEEKSKFSILKSGSHGGSIIATSFFKANNLDSKKLRGRYNWTKENLEGAGEIYVIDLKEIQDRGNVENLENMTIPNS